MQNINPNMSQGKVELILGCMFASKTSSLIKRIEKCKSDNIKYAVIKHSSDNRYEAEDYIVSHDQVKCLVNFSVNKLEQIDPTLLIQYEYIFIEESHFFSDLVEFVEKWAALGKNIVCVALSGTFEREPWPQVARLISKADKTEILYAKCTICGNSASNSKRLVKSTAINLIGGAETYAARCRNCFYIDNDSGGGNDNNESKIQEENLSS